jgi:pimeloyl-ACP methyl ester carboxylesterase
MSYAPLRTPRHTQLNVRGLKHHLTWWGEPTDTPIVLLHGFMDCGATWQFLADCLPEHCSLVAPDWRGFGASEWASQGYWFPDYLADLEVMLDALVPSSRARVIGHSMGANIATLYAGIRPQRLQWLVNLEGIGLPRTDPACAPARYAEWLDELKEPLRVNRYDSLQQLATVLRKRNPRLAPERAEFVARAWSREAEGGVQLTFDPRHRFVNPVLYRLEEAEACWARIEVPMLMIVGGLSGQLERRESDGGEDRLHSLFRNLQIATLPGSGHMMHHEDPQGVALKITEFRQQHP